MPTLSIKQWKENERPRERLAELGAAALSDSELLAILIGSGNASETAVGLMRRILNDCGGNLGQLGKMTLPELCAYNGIGPAKAITIMAACELGKRRQSESVEERKRISSSRDMYDYFHPLMRDLPIEECHVILLNQALNIIGSKCVGRGGITATVVDVRLVLREALLSCATQIGLCHNHPSGNTRPSREDDKLTARLKQAAEAMDIKLIDHIVITDGSYFSYSDEGRL